MKNGMDPLEKAYLIQVCTVAIIAVNLLLQLVILYKRL